MLIIIIIIIIIIIRDIVRLVFWLSEPQLPHDRIASLLYYKLYIPIDTVFKYRFVQRAGIMKQLLA